MTYSKQSWVDGQTPVDAEHMNHIEDGIASAIPGARYRGLCTGAGVITAGTGFNCTRTAVGDYYIGLTAGAISNAVAFVTCNTAGIICSAWQVDTTTIVCWLRDPAGAGVDLSFGFVVFDVDAAAATKPAP